MLQAELMIDSKAELGEGPCWDEQRQLLYWVDILAGHVHSLNVKTRTERVMEVGHSVGAVVLCSQGGLLLATEQGFYTLDLNDGALAKIADPEKDRPGNRFNDGKCDPSGRFWAGTMSKHGEKNSGSLYRLDNRFNVKKMIGEVDISNGLGWSPDTGTMYFIDSSTRTVQAFDFERHTGDISNGRVIVEIPEGQGVPDGMTVDSEGMLWVAQWGGYRVSRWNPATGELLETIRVPAAQVSSCTFGGEQMDELYITTARTGLSLEELAAYPHSGGVFKIKTGTKGVPAFRFESEFGRDGNAREANE